MEGMMTMFCHLLNGRLMPTTPARWTRVRAGATGGREAVRILPLASLVLPLLWWAVPAAATDVMYSFGSNGNGNLALGYAGASEHRPKYVAGYGDIDYGLSGGLPIRSS
jgi:hypothetical protein